MTTPTITGIIGNPRPQSRTHSLCRGLVAELAAVAGTVATEEVDLAALGPRTLDRGYPDTAAALAWAQANWPVLKSTNLVKVL